MKMIVMLVDILCTYNEIFWMYRWINLFLKKRPYIQHMKDGEKYIERILQVIYILTVFFLNRIELTSAYTMVIVMIMSYVTVLCFWKANLMQTSAVVGGYFLMLFLVGNIVISFTGLLGGDELILKCTGELGMIRLIYLIMNGVMWYVLNHYFVIFVNNQNIQIQSLKVIRYVSIVGFIGSAFIGMVLVNSFSVHVSIIWYAFMLFILFVIFVSYFIVEQKGAKAKLTVLAAKNGILERNYMQINEFYMTNAKLYHDMNHHFEVLYQLLHNEKQEQAKRYLEKLRMPLNYDEVEVHTGISVLDTVLHEMGIKAREKKIVLETEISLLPSDLAIENGDICSLFANLLENAVEASSSNVYIQIKKVNQTLLTLVKNDYVIKPVIKDGKLMSSKKDKILHGWGTQIVEQIVQKYEGSMEYYLEGNQFVVSVMINEMIDE